MIPQTISTSYGDDEQTVPLDYAASVCELFGQLGARGSSVLFSSGDFGVGGGSCLSNDGEDRRQFTPMFPASCESFLISFFCSHTCEIGIYWWFMRPLRHGRRRYDQSEP